jgi:hypothetical protein
MRGMVAFCARFFLVHDLLLFDNLKPTFLHVSGAVRQGEIITKEIILIERDFLRPAAL